MIGDRRVVVNDENLRELQSRKVADGIESIGSYCNVLKRGSRINIWLSVGITVFMMLFIGFGVYLGLQSGGLDGLYDTGAVSRRFNCSGNEGVVDVVRSYEDAEFFVGLYGGECVVWHQS